MHKIITATLHNLSPVPPNSVYQGTAMFEFETHKDPENLTKKYAEYDPELKIYYKDPSVKIELVSDLVVAEAEKTEVITKTDVKIDEYLAAAVDVSIEVKPK